MQGLMELSAAVEASQAEAAAIQVSAAEAGVSLNQLQPGQEPGPCLWDMLHESVKEQIFSHLSARDLVRGPRLTCLMTTASMHPVHAAASRRVHTAQQGPGLAWVTNAHLCHIMETFGIWIQGLPVLTLPHTKARVAWTCRDFASRVRTGRVNARSLVIPAGGSHHN